jgi:hypothetical protein
MDMRRRCVVFVAALIGVVALLPSAADATTTPKTALIYGDSLTLEAAPIVAARFAPRSAWRVVVKSIPGVALCEYAASLASDLTTYHPTVVTIETHGGTNSPVTGCFDQTLVRDSPDYYARIRADIDGDFSAVTATGAKVVFFATPPDKSAISEVEQDTITGIALSEAGHFHGVSVSKAGRSALGGSKWRGTMNCLATELALPDCVGGKIIVRAPDTVHFCPAGYVDYWAFFTGCTVYSSGALRYGRAMANVTISPPKPVLP